jgi:cardiolipin synthase
VDWHIAAWVAEAGWIAVVAVWIALERRPPAATLAWIVGLALLPVVGVPVYFFFGPRRLARKKRRYRGLRERLEHQLAELAREPSLPPDVIRQVRLGVRLDESPLATATALEPYRDGVALFEALCRDVAAARSSVHLEYYIWEPDATGRRLLELLVERARAGVRVRVLVDALGASAGAGFFAPLIGAGGRVARFNPPRPGSLRMRLLNFRTHRKIAVVDGRAGYVGGMNIADCHTTGAGGAPPWRDSHLRIEGTAVRSLQRTFFENWQFATDDATLDPRDFPELPEGGVRMQILRSGPDREVYPIHEFMFTAIAGADERVWIASPYVVPDEAMLAALRSAAHRGVDVRLLVPDRGDSRLVAAAGRAYHAELLASGVRIWAYGPAMLHAKTLVVDRELALVGSANLDNRSFRLNFEVAAAIYDGAAADCLAAWFEEDLAVARRITLRDALRRRWPERLAESGARLFAAVL